MPRKRGALGRSRPRPFRLDTGRYFSPDALVAIVTDVGHAGCVRIARRYGCTPDLVRAKRAELKKAADARAKCPAFLPDDGIPYTMVARRLLV